MSHQPPGQDPYGNPQGQRPYYQGQQPPAPGQPVGDYGYQSRPPYAGNPAGRHESYPMAVSDQERSMAILAHLSTIIALVVSAGWLSFVGPLAMWYLYKDKSPFVRQSAAGSFNFNLSMWLLSIIGWICFFTVIGIPIAIICWTVSVVAQIVFHISGALRANRGEMYRYPMQFLTILH